MSNENILQTVTDVLEDCKLWIPTQGPIDSFVHHNTLHSFEMLPFHNALKLVRDVRGCSVYWPSERYIQKFKEGRFSLSHIETAAKALLKESGLINRFQNDDSDSLRNLSLVVMCQKIKISESENKWCQTSDGFLKHHQLVTQEYKTRLREDWRKYCANPVALPGCLQELPKKESYELDALWRLVNEDVANFVNGNLSSPVASHRIRTPMVDEKMARFASSYFDQGISYWPMPERSSMLNAFLSLHPRTVKRLPVDVRDEVHNVSKDNQLAPAFIVKLLRHLNVSEAASYEFLLCQILAMPGWFGLTALSDTNKKLFKHVRTNIAQLLVCRLMLLVEELSGFGRRSEARDCNFEKKSTGNNTQFELGFDFFQFVQMKGLNISDYLNLPKEKVSDLLQLLNVIPEVDRQMILQEAFELGYYHQISASLNEAAIRKRSQESSKKSQRTFQIYFCLDDRCESIRRHLEEIDPKCETFGVAGFYNVDMLLKRTDSEGLLPLCPGFMSPDHVVHEQVTSHVLHNAFQRMEQRFWHQSLRTLRKSGLGSLLTMTVGSLSIFPLFTKVWFPGFSQKIRRTFGALFKVPEVKKLNAYPPQEDLKEQSEFKVGFTIEEMTNRVEDILKSSGLVDNFAPFVFMLGHGATTSNNPHSAAYECGACGGRKGEYNGRVFAQMANDRSVRQKLVERGLEIPDSCIFVGGYFDTCADQIELDLDPVDCSDSLAGRDNLKLLKTIKKTFDDALALNSLERCRRLDAKLTQEAIDNPIKALNHVRARSFDLREPRPELGHTLNVDCIVGDRELTKGLFLDRRAFLTSYLRDIDPDGTILERTLQSIIPVCAGINLEYYFSHVDNEVFGCGAKLPHNIVGLFGVMTGGSSDLRTGLPWQMVEFHEPIRLALYIDSDIETLTAIIGRNPSMQRLFNGEWVKLFLLDIEEGQTLYYKDGVFELFTDEKHHAGTYESSLRYFAGRQDSLKPAVCGGV